MYAGGLGLLEVVGLLGCMVFPFFGQFQLRCPCSPHLKQSPFFIASSLFSVERASTSIAFGSFLVKVNCRGEFPFPLISLFLSIFPSCLRAILWASLSFALSSSKACLYQSSIVLGTLAAPQEYIFLRSGVSRVSSKRSLTVGESLSRFAACASLLHDLQYDCLFVARVSVP